MMKTEFCSACGNKIEYSFAAPNFCSRCGNALRKDGATPRQEAAASLSGPVMEEQEKVPSISKLEYDVDYESLGAKRVKLGDLAMQENSGPSQRRPKKRGRKPKPPSKEEFLVKSVAECRSVGNNTKDVSGE